MDSISHLDANSIHQFTGKNLLYQAAIFINLDYLFISFHSNHARDCVCVFDQVGLAVDDIKGIQENAELKRLALRVSVINNTNSCTIFMIFVVTMLFIGGINFIC